MDGVKVYVSPESIAWGINYCLNDPVFMKDMGKMGRQKLDKFRWENIAREMVGVYRSLSETEGRIVI